MRIIRNFDIILRMTIGLAVAIHGFIRVIGIYDYVDFVVARLDPIFNNDSLLIFGATLLPFLEVLSGLLIFFRLNMKTAVLVALSICLIMSVMIILGNLSTYRLVFHVLMIIGLLILYFRYRDLFISNRLV